MSKRIARHHSQAPLCLGLLPISSPGTSAGPFLASNPPTRSDRQAPPSQTESRPRVSVLFPVVSCRRLEPFASNPPIAATFFLDKPTNIIHRFGSAGRGIAFPPLASKCVQLNWPFRQAPIRNGGRTTFYAKHPGPSGRGVAEGRPHGAVPQRRHPGGAGRPP